MMSIRIDKNKYVEDLAMTAEKAAIKGNMKQLYDTTKKLAGNYCKPEQLVKSKEAKVVLHVNTHPALTKNSHTNISHISKI
ncbi:unnamed protein product [Schistosoma mattheei]|uniref:Uncharacterized protein n=1 Tax=Schistosoma mattheei TaxID=31246 RepID=A0A183PKQ8_9TREM|nr:unnamed protein product [Schistosoma mattheei]